MFSSLSTGDITFSFVICRYNSTTGMFTVPSGGDGYYYFSLNLRVKSGIGSDFDIRIGNDVLCSTFTDLSDSTDADSVMASCSGTASVSAGSYKYERPYHYTV